MPGGYMGKLLFVDLTTGRMEVEEPEEELYRKFIGGYGLGAKVLFDRMKPGADPLGPDNILGFVTGPLTGTPALSGSRYSIVCKSPLTGTWGDANSGGEFGPGLKFAGYDAVFLSGVSPRPVYLLIDEGRVELRDAAHLWGKDTHETEDLLWAEHGGDAQAVCIGPSGERLALISCPINNKGRAPGRSGGGAVMGSKRLKAIVVKGKLEVPLAQKTRTTEVRRRGLKEEKEGPLAPFYELFTTFGTSGGTADSAHSGDSPVKNWGGVGTVDFPHAEPLGGPTVIPYQRKRYPCWRCNIACGGEMKPQTSGRYTWDKNAHKPEYETLASFGTLNLINDTESIIKANDICNRYGLDTISAGCTISFAIECFENGLITAADTGGIELRWGNAEAMIAMLEKLAQREGFGDVLADGVKVAAQRIGKGAEQYAIEVGGQEPGMHDPKFGPHWATSFVMDATPGRHTQMGEWFPLPEIGVGMHDPKVYTGRGDAHRRAAAWGHYLNATGMCLFAAILLSPSYIAEAMSAATGWEVTPADLVTVGERIGNLRHAFNIREGINPLEFKVHGRVIGDPPQTEGPHQGVTVDLQTMIREYLEAAGWDPVTTKPSRERLLSLGLEEVAEQLYPEPAMA